MNPDEINAKVTRLVALNQGKKDLDREEKILRSEFKEDAGDDDYTYGDEAIGFVKVAHGNQSRVCTKKLIKKFGSGALLDCYVNNPTVKVEIVPPKQKKTG